MVLIWWNLTKKNEGIDMPTSHWGSPSQRNPTRDFSIFSFFHSTPKKIFKQHMIFP